MGLFREYDLRGIVGKELTEEIAERVGRAYCTHVQPRGVKRISVGRDGRLSSPALHRALVKGLLAGGLDVVDIGICPSPLVYFSLFHLPVDGGIMITGSHNAAEYNGFKICVGKEAIHGEEIQALRRVMEQGQFVSGQGTLSEHPIIPDYLAYIKKSFAGVNAGRLHVVIDCGSGAAALVAKQALELLGCKVTGLYCELDGRFPHHHPDPTVLENLSDLMRATTEPARFGEALVEGYATTLIPKIIGQPATIMDPYKREVDGVFDAIQSQMPYLREKLAPKIDIWGSLTENERLFRVTPIATAKMSEDKVKTEAVRLELGITRAPKYIEERTPLKPMQERTKLTPAQRGVLQEVTGTYALQELSRIVSQPAWDKLPDYAQAALYKKVIERAQTIGKNQALSPDSPERVAKRKEAWEEVLRQNEAAKAR